MRFINICMLSIVSTASVLTQVRILPGDSAFPPPTRVPLSIYMPYDVLLGYVALDSVLRWTAVRVPSERDTNVRYWMGDRQRIGQVLDFLRRRVQWDDTLRKLVRSVYAMSEYDAILYESTMMMNPPFEGYWPPSFLLPVTYREWILAGVSSANREQPRPIRLRDMILLRSHYIAHIKVVDTVHFHPLGYRSPLIDYVLVTAEVIDLIKGRVLPPCDSRWTHGPRFQMNSLADTPLVFRPWLRSPMNTGWQAFAYSSTFGAASMTGAPACIQFRYMPGAWMEWCDDIAGRTYGDSIYPGREYIVMLVVGITEKYPPGEKGPWTLPDTLRSRIMPMVVDLVPSDTTSLPFNCPPELYWEGNMAAYPIEYREGEPYILFYKDDFGLGQEVPLAWFKDWLRERIAQYRSW